METGLVGLALFFSMLIPLIVHFTRGLRASEVDWRTSAFMGFLVYSLLEAQVSGTYMSLNYVWVSMGILAAWPRMAGHRQTQRVYTRSHGAWMVALRA